MNKFLLICTGAVMLLAGCVSRSPEHYEELSEKERSALLHTARALALRGDAVPPHLKSAFVKLAPHERIIYNGDKHGKAAFRWEIYEKRSSSNKITQKDVNPYWVMIYAIGDLRDPAWKLTHANQGDIKKNSQFNPAQSNSFRGRQFRHVRYKNQSVKGSGL